MAPSRDPIPPGTLDMLILQTVVRLKKSHGFQIAEAIRAASSDVLQVEEGSLYPALQRLLVQGWLVGEWGRTAENRRARYYHITRLGEKQLVRELDGYRRVSVAIAAVLSPA
jgi:PadR family transcriptional regulator, regulatory protein PadR